MKKIYRHKDIKFAENRIQFSQLGENKPESKFLYDFFKKINEILYGILLVVKAHPFKY